MCWRGPVFLRPHFILACGYDRIESACNYRAGVNYLDNNISLLLAFLREAADCSDTAVLDTAGLRGDFAVLGEALNAFVRANCKAVCAHAQSHELMRRMAGGTAHALFVVDGAGSVAYRNEAALAEQAADPHYIDKLLGTIAQNAPALQCGATLEFTHTGGGLQREIAISGYQLLWNGGPATVYLVRDITAERRLLHELQQRADHDGLTQLHNRYAGMKILAEWMESGRLFSLVFADLNRLKYVNDVFGHGAGDIYIVAAARALEAFSPDTVACRIGGDEFMLLAPGYNEKDALARMAELAGNLLAASRGSNKPYDYSISYGVVGVPPGNTLTAGQVLRAADERMYEHKRASKQAV